MAVFALVMAVIFLTAAVAGVSCDVAVISPPIADFEHNMQSSDTMPVKVGFTSFAKGAKLKTGAWDPVVSYSWTFGDGKSSTAKDPVHSYTEMAGNIPYDVTLTVTTECHRHVSVTKKVRAYCTCPQAGFTIVQPAGPGPYVAPVTLVLQDTSIHAPEPVTTYTYELSKDEDDYRDIDWSHEKNPTFKTITESGKYLILQFVRKKCNWDCSDLINDKAIRFTVIDPPTSVTTTITTTVTEASTIPEISATIPTSSATTAWATATTTTAPAATSTVSATTGTPQPAAPASPGTGTLSVITNPAGAQVFVEDAMYGATPASVSGLSPGSHMLRLVHTGYQNMSVPVTITDGKTAEYSFTLVPESGGGMGILPVIAGVLVIAAVGGGAYWYFRKKGQAPPATK